MTRLNQLAAILAAVLMAAVSLATPSIAMDSKKVAPGGPDLTKVRAEIKREAWPAALKLLEPMAKSHPNSADVFNLTGYAQRRSGAFDSSLVSYQRALKLDPKHLEAHVYLGELYIQTGKLEKAVAQSKIIAQLCPAGCEPRAELEAALRKAGWK